MQEFIMRGKRRKSIACKTIGGYFMYNSKKLCSLSLKQDNGGEAESKQRREGLKVRIRRIRTRRS